MQLKHLGFMHGFRRTWSLYLCLEWVEPILWGKLPLGILCSVFLYPVKGHLPTLRPSHLCRILEVWRTKEVISPSFPLIKTFLAISNLLKVIRDISGNVMAQIHMVWFCTPCSLFFVLKVFLITKYAEDREKHMKFNWFYIFSTYFRYFFKK